jgi:hypothetical protein
VIVEDPQYSVHVSFAGNVSNVQPGHSSHSRGSIMKCNLAGSNLVSTESTLPLQGGWSCFYSTILTYIVVQGVPVKDVCNAVSIVHYVCCANDILPCTF